MYRKLNRFTSSIDLKTPRNKVSSLFGGSSSSLDMNPAADTPPIPPNSRVTAAAADVVKPHYQSPPSEPSTQLSRGVHVASPNTLGNRNGLGTTDPLSLPDICHKIYECTSGNLLSLPGGSSPKYRISSMPLGPCLNIPITPGALTKLSQPVSLQTLLHGGDPSSPKLNRKDRFLIGIKLASSVIQLHHTWWLSGPWSKKNIIFFSNPQTNTLLKEKPVVLHELGDGDRRIHSDQHTGVKPDVKSRPLFLLGLVLWELWYGRCFEDRIQQRQTCNDNQDQLAGDYLQWPEDTLIVQAFRAIDDMDMDGDACPSYAKAVRECLCGGIQLSDEDFIVKTWMKIVWPLEQLYGCY